MATLFLDESSGKAIAVAVVAIVSWRSSSGADINVPRDFWTIRLGDGQHRRVTCAG